MLTILGIALVIISTLLIYRSAKQNGHNAVKWTVISAVTGVLLQIVIPLLSSIILVAVWMSSGKTMRQIEEDILAPALIIGVVCLVLNVAVAALIMKKVALIAEENPVAPPPPPDDYNVDG